MKSLRGTYDTGFLPFLGSLWESWVARISGPASAILLLLAFFVPNAARLLTSIAAVLCLVISAYQIWLVERLRARGLAERLKPAFRFDLEHPSCKMKEGQTVYLRVALWNTGIETIDDCIVEICEMNPSPIEWIGRYPIPLRVMHSEAGASLVLRNGQPALIDLIVFVPGSGGFLVMHALPGKVAALIPDRSFRFVLQAAGRGVTACSHAFELDFSVGYPTLTAVQDIFQQNGSVVSNPT
jgi:hypothetical protein